MKKIINTMLCLFALVSFTNIAYAQNDNCGSCDTCETCEPCEPCKPCCTEVPQTGEPCNCAYNAPARIDPACGWDAWATLSFLYWQPKEKGLDIGYQTTITTAGDPAIITTSKNPINLSTDYHPGFKIGLGMSDETDNWTLYLEYTRLKSDDSSSRDITSTYDGVNDSLSTTWIHESNTSNLKAKWDISYNTFDLELGRPYYLGKKLVFSPHYGLRAGWIDQKYNVDTVANADIDPVVLKYTVRNKQDSWLIGPRVGVKTDWKVGCDFRLFGNVAGSLTYQSFKPSININTPAHGEALEVNYKSKNDVSYITPNVELALGLGYGSYFCNNEWYYDITVGYDFHYYWNQNFIASLNDLQIGFLNGDAGNLMLHGLTITARLDF